MLRDADREHTALGHFNFSELVVLNAVVTPARGLGVLVLVGVSECERDFIGVRQAAALVKSIREEFGMPIFLNADHTHSLEKAIEAAKVGFHMVVFDVSADAFVRAWSKRREQYEETANSQSSRAPRWLATLR